MTKRAHVESERESDRRHNDQPYRRDARSANDSCGAFGFTPAICDGICLKRLRSRNSAMPIAAASNTNAAAEYGAMMPTSSTALMPDTLKR